MAWFVGMSCNSKLHHGEVGGRRVADINSSAGRWGGVEFCDCDAPFFLPLRSIFAWNAKSTPRVYVTVAEREKVGG